MADNTKSLDLLMNRFIVVIMAAVVLAAIVAPALAAPQAQEAASEELVAWLTTS